MSFAHKINVLSRERRLGAKLRQAPLPLLDARRRTVISWSAKSACTHVLIWYLHRLGLLDEARNYHPWVHRYRSEALYRSEIYRSAREQLVREGLSQWNYVKVVRDPVKRCVSSYRHALKHGYEDEKMSHVLNREINHKSGYSYETFLEYLAQIDLHHCDIHHRVQKHSLDTMEFARTWLINVDEQDLDAALAEIDRIQGCPPLDDHEGSSQAIASAARRHADQGRDDRPHEAAQWRMSLAAGDVEQWPKRALVSALPAVKVVRRIYRCDYDILARLNKAAEAI